MRISAAGQVERMTPNEGREREPTQNASHFPFFAVLFEAFLHEAETSVRCVRSGARRRVRVRFVPGCLLLRVAEKKICPFYFSSRPRMHRLRMNHEIKMHACNIMCDKIADNLVACNRY